MIINQIADKEGILAWQAQARDAGFVITNLFPDVRKLDDWVRREAVMSVDGFADCRLLLVKEAGFDRIFFCALAINAAAKACAEYQQSTAFTCVIDVVGPAAFQKVASGGFCASGFEVYKTLTRMQRRSGVESYEIVSPVIVRPTGKEDAIHIYAALRQFFDARAEQLPCIEEVCELCMNGSSFVSCVGDVVCAFLLGEIQGKKGTIRYWFTSSQCRGKGVGSALMRAFFDCCLEIGSTFQELWVLDDNENAIKRYEHYGFAFDRLKDVVFIGSSKEN